MENINPNGKRMVDWFYKQKKKYYGENFQSISSEEAKYLLSFLPKRPDYDTWIKAISSIGNSFNTMTALDILKSHFEDEKPDEHLKKLQNRLNNIGIGTLIHIAKRNGYDLEINPFRIQKMGNIPYNRKMNKIIQRECVAEFLYKFCEYEYEERAAIHEFEAQMTRRQAEQLVITHYPNVSKDRAYRIAINRKVINKTNDYKTLTNNFKNCVLTPNEIAKEIKRGHAICCSVLKEDNYGHTIRKNDSWLSSELFALDIDHGLTIDEALNKPQSETALMLYTSHSHSENNNRFRLIFDLPYLEKNSNRYQEIIKKFISVYGSDNACKDLCRGFFGNTNAVVYLLRSGEVL
jgi:hypothetical protein